MNPNFNYSETIAICWRRNDETRIEPCLYAAIKHDGGNILVCGCISGESVGNLVKIVEKLAGEKYGQILKHQAVFSGL